MELDLSWPVLWNGLFWPLMRLTFFISVGLFVGNLIESLRWTRYAAVLAAPLARRARLKDVSAASFTMAFFSGIAANTMLSEAHSKGDLSDRELILSNLFNALPTYFLHLPSIFFVVAAIGTAGEEYIYSVAVTYIGLTALAAVIRTTAITFSGRYLLPPLTEGCIPCRLDEMEKKRDKSSALKRTWKRFKKRLPKVLYITAPIYVLFFMLKQLGLFAWLQTMIADDAAFFTFLPPEALSIIVLQMAAELTAGVAAASVLLVDSTLTSVQIVLALMVGNILSTPMRAFRHQFPYYAGIFKPRMAFKLIVFNQIARASTVALVGFCYAWIMI